MLSAEPTQVPSPDRDITTSAQIKSWTLVSHVPVHWLYPWKGYRGRYLSIVVLPLKFLFARHLLVVILGCF